MVSGTSRSSYRHLTTELAQQKADQPSDSSHDPLPEQRRAKQSRPAIRPVTAEAASVFILPERRNAAMFSCRAAWQRCGPLVRRAAYLPRGGECTIRPECIETQHKVEYISITVCLCACVFSLTWCRPLRAAVIEHDVLSLIHSCTPNWRLAVVSHSDTKLHLACRAKPSCPRSYVISCPPPARVACTLRNVS